MVTKVFVVSVLVIVTAVVVAVVLGIEPRNPTNLTC